MGFDRQTFGVESKTNCQGLAEQPSNSQDGGCSGRDGHGSHLLSAERWVAGWMSAVLWSRSGVVAAIAVGGTVTSRNGGALRRARTSATELVGGRDIRREWARGPGRSLDAS